MPYVYQPTAADKVVIEEMWGLGGWGAQPSAWPGWAQPLVDAGVHQGWLAEQIRAGRWPHEIYLEAPSWGAR